MTVTATTNLAEFIKPGSPEWLRTITPSKVPSILGVSRWKSQYTLWHEMAGQLDPEPISEARQDDFDYGHACELAGREYWKYKNPGWRISRGEVQLSNSGLPFANVATVDLRGSRGAKRRVVEVKTARDLGEFGDDGSGEIPRDYAAQILAQMLITGWHEPANLVCWAQFGKPRIYTVEWAPDIAEVIVQRCVDWLDSLAAGVKPPLDDTLSTYEAMRRLHPDIDGSTVQITPELACQLLDWDRDLQGAEKRVRGFKTELLDAMGNARYAEIDGLRVATRQPGGRGSVALVLARKNYDELMAAHHQPYIPTGEATA